MIDLTACTGPLKGSRFVLEGDELIIGRTTRGVNLPDPDVSVNHARVFVLRGQPVLEDMGSVKGTRLNGEPIQPRNPAPLDVGDQVTIGETTFKVGSGRVRAIRRAMLAMIPSWVLVFVAATIMFWATGERPATLGLASPVRTHDGEVSQLTFPKPFLRRHGIALSGLGLRQVTDLDADGIDELWLQHGEHELIVTFDADGTWRLLGELPLGCLVREREGDLSCGRTTYRAVDGVYQPITQEEPVVWLRGPLDLPEVAPDAEPPKLPLGGARLQAGQLVAYRMEPGEVDRIAGFLAERGVTEPVHAILCEDGVAGLPAQAVAENGEAHRFSFPCDDAIQLAGPRAAEFPGARVVAIALSAAGHAGLPELISRSLSGATEPLFLDPADSADVEQLGVWPLDSRGGLRLHWTDTPHVFAPFASGPLGPGRLLVNGSAPLDAVTSPVVQPGAFALPVPGSCARLEVRAPPFRCATLRGCLPWASFLRVRETGCGDPVDLVATGFGDGVWAGTSDNVDVRVRIESEGSLMMRDVLRATVSARPVGTGG